MTVIDPGLELPGGIGGLIDHLILGRKTMRKLKTIVPTCKVTSNRSIRRSILKLIGTGSNSSYRRAELLAVLKDIVAEMEA